MESSDRPEELVEGLAAFVVPADPALAVPLDRARLVVAERARGVGDAEAGDALLPALWTVLADLGLRREADPDAAPRPPRTPGEVLAAGRADPLEAALLLASLLERAGLAPHLVRRAGRVLVAAARPEGDLPLDPSFLLEGGSFGDAAEAARRLLEAEDLEPPQRVDVARAREAGIHPRTAPPTARDAPPPTALPEPLPRVERWKRNLLDLTLRNRLLHHRPTLRTIALRLPDPGAVLAGLAEGRSYRFLAEPEEGLGAEEAARAVTEGWLPTFVGEDELLHRLVTTARHARASLEEGGANTLYLAVGFLTWRESGPASPARRAPLLLVPLRMARGSAAQGVRGYRIEADDDEPRLNVTLLQKLRADFDLEIPGLQALARDDAEVDLARVLDAAAEAVRGLEGWTVTPDVVVGLFSFTKYLMWRDLERRGGELRENAIVRHLLDAPQEPFPQDAALPDATTFDATRPPSGTFTPLDADSTQLAAVHAAADGLSYVLEGPPGTGKSQTIANLVCHALARGERVLFASEKMAALGVVHGRLERMGLGPFCLELHSNRSRKRDVLEQLRAALDAAGGDDDGEAAWREATAHLAEVTAALNATRDVLHAPGPFGPSVREASARTLALAGAPAVALDLDFEGGAFDREAFEAARRAVHDAAAVLREVGDVPGAAWRASRLEDWSPALGALLAPKAAAVAAALDAVESAAEATGAALGVEATTRSLRDLETLAEAADPPWGSDRDLGTRYEAAALDLDLDDLARRLAASRRTFWPLSWLRARTPRRVLGAVWKGDGPLPRADRLAGDVEALQRRRARRANLESWVAGLRPTSAAPVPDPVDAGGAELARRLEAAAAARRDLEAAFDLDPEAAWGPGTRRDFLGHARAALAALLADPGALRAWTAWRRARAALLARGLAPLVAALEDGRVDAATLADAFERGVLDAWLARRFEEEPRLRRFRGAEQEERVASLRAADARVRKLAREVVRARLARGLPRGDVAAASKSDSSEMAVLLRELRRKRNLPIRRLFARIPHVLARLKPCMLMSPLSVAQYLGPDFPPFDLVVFDEASQIPPWDAVGAIARGRRLVVVGDSKQLPPTTFFQRTDEDDDVFDEDALQETESILDECGAAGLPRLHLGWHYRSRHESLIAFSNRHYYEDRLVTFPSASYRADGLGVAWRPVEDGVYDRSRSRTNPREAEVLVAALVARLEATAPGDRSFGVVTFSIAQQGLVEDLLEDARREHPAIEAHFDEALAEPVFVKNLENVQGDERDEILLSVCYGPDASGRVTLNFGPLNREGGERRLNVAITRARRHVTVFSSLRAERIDPSRTQAVGARHLRAFLEYAERGPEVLGPAADPRARPPEPDAFARQVEGALRADGWKVQPQVGRSAFRVELAVDDPAADGRHLVALETDGAPYARAATARDRHVTRPGVLAHLGWHHGRIWALDWLFDPDRETRGLRDRLGAWRAASPDAPPAPVAEAPAATGDAPPPPASLGAALGGTPYRRVALRARRQEPAAFYEAANDASVAAAIARVVADEAPLAMEALARRLAERWGVERLTARFRQRVRDLALLDGAHRLDDQGFLWRADQDPGRYAGFRVPEAGARPPRRAAHVPPVEVANAAAALLHEHLAIDAGDLARELAGVFGFRRATARVLGAMQAGVDLLLARGGARRDGDLLRPPEAPPGPGMVAPGRAPDAAPSEEDVE